MDYLMSVVRTYERCGSSAEVHGCSESWVRRLLQQGREHGSYEPGSKVRKTSSRICTAEDGLRIRQFIAEKPDATLVEVAAALAKPIHPSTVSRTLTRLNLP